MSYYIYKLKFNNGIHIGDGGSLEKTAISMKSNTFFSAIYSEYMRIFSDDMLLNAIKRSEFCISDLLPYKDDILYIPKPYVSVERNTSNNINKKVDKKTIKKIGFIPVEKLNAYINFLKTGENLPYIDNNFGNKELLTKNQISRTGDDTKLYNVEIFRFNKNCGLYFIISMNEKLKSRIDVVIDSLSTTGIGGKRTSGYGIFEMMDDEIKLFESDNRPVVSESDFVFNKLLHNKNANNYMLLSSYLPQKEDIRLLENGNNFYSLIKISGFINSPYYSNSPVKKKQVYMISSGSVLNYTPNGRIADLNINGNHSIFLLGKPIVMGVNI